MSVSFTCSKNRLRLNINISTGNASDYSQEEEGHLFCFPTHVALAVQNPWHKARCVLCYQKIFSALRFLRYLHWTPLHGIAKDKHCDNKGLKKTFTVPNSKEQKHGFLNHLNSMN
jgi:hypothetical protein